MLSILLLWKRSASSCRASSPSIIIEKQPKRLILSQTLLLQLKKAAVSEAIIHRVPQLWWLRHVESRSEWDSVLVVRGTPAPDNPSTEKEACLLSALMALVWQESFKLEYWKVEKGTKSTTLTTWRDHIFQVPGSFWKLTRHCLTWSVSPVPSGLRRNLPPRPQAMHLVT